MFGSKPEPDLSYNERFRMFFAAHWAGVVIILTPIVGILILLPFPPKTYQWCAYSLFVMGVYWVFECIPLPITSFIPVVIFPITNVMSTMAVSKCYVNDTVIMFLGSLMLAYSVEFSGLHKRMAYTCIRIIGYTHVRLLGALACCTTFVSMWITNTAATTVMVPIIFAILKVFEDQKVLKVYETNQAGDKVASDITTCYFCTVTYCATIGGIGTLIGTGTNLVLKGLFINAYPDAPELLSFPKFSLFTVPLMLSLLVTVYGSMCVVYLGLGRPNSKAAKSATINKKTQDKIKLVIQEESKKLGRISMWEIMVLLLFGTAIVLFFMRSPQMIQGWGDSINDHFGLKNPKFVLDSAVAMVVCFIMFLLPNSCAFFKNFTARTYEQLPSTPVPNVLIWKRLNEIMPFSFIFLLGGGFAFSTGAKMTGLNEQIGTHLRSLKDLPNWLVLLIVIFVVVIVTNIASNIAICNVFCPIAMQLAKEIKVNPLWYNFSTGIASSFCFLLPVGTPGNLVVASAAKIPTIKMIKAGGLPTVFAVLLIWAFSFVYGPIVWPVLHSLPTWAAPATP